MPVVQANSRLVFKYWGEVKRGLLRTYLTSLHWPILQQLLSLPHIPVRASSPCHSTHSLSLVGPAVRHAAKACQAGLKLVAGQPAMFRVAMTAEYSCCFPLSAGIHLGFSLPWGPVFKTLKTLYLWGLKFDRNHPNDSKGARKGRSADKNDHISPVPSGNRLENVCMSPSENKWFTKKITHHWGRIFWKPIRVIARWHASLNNTVWPPAAPKSVLHTEGQQQEGRHGATEEAPTR